MRLLTGLFALCTISVQAANYAVSGAKVHTMSQQGSLNEATVLVKDGKIEKVLSGTHKPAGYEVIDAKGKVVTPGLIGAYTSLGLVEVSSSAGIVDASSKKSEISKQGAALDVSYAINPDSTLIPVSRLGGITSAATGMYGSGLMFNGQGAIISLGDAQQPILKKKAFNSTSVASGGANANGGTRAALWVSLNAMLEEVKYASGMALNPDTEWHGLLTKADISALQPVLNGEIPLLIDVRRTSDIRQVLALKEREPALNIVLLNATEAWRLADELSKAEIGVILNPEANLPSSFEQLGATLKNAARLQQAGVTVAIGMNTHNIRLARQHAGNAVSNGLPWQAGLAALTSNVAQLYGVEDQLGSLAPGAQADLVIWSGDPLEVAEDAEQVIIKGQLMPMESRQTRLRDRYLQYQRNLATQKDKEAKGSEPKAAYIRP